MHYNERVKQHYLKYMHATVINMKDLISGTGARCECFLIFMHTQKSIIELTLYHKANSQKAVYCIALQEIWLYSTQYNSY